MRLRRWLLKMVHRKKEEPNSALGKASTYMLNHWKNLTKFMSVAGAPLDNNICERAVKTPMRHRKNSLFFKTEFGALIGDIYMSLIQTCKNVKANPLQYLQEIMKNQKDLFENPEKWMPWNYTEQLL